ncbi:hypothetical protein [Nonomuraea basaltis]|uniref:hypothetical protein n=1 Tax=Nonomuraea basaltis TaxID=2495887 RepID=UPI00110C5B58|nr:hypothetical protein [Nonomuraea basaltis]TMR95235.1 hypothetical protein EJK15_29860 [Nonomuraea basaltis]
MPARPTRLAIAATCVVTVALTAFTGVLDWLPAADWARSVTCAPLCAPPEPPRAPSAPQLPRP